MDRSRIKKAGELFAVFFKIGAFTFGGGYAMIPLIQKETSERKKWLDDGDILDIIAIAESTPGPIAINSATFIGYKTAGLLGAVAATLGVVLPSFVVISLIALLLEHFAEYRAVRYAFAGIRAGVLALLVKAVVSMFKKSPKGAVPYALIALAFAVSAFTDVNVIFVIIACGVIGLVSSLITGRGGAK